MIEVKITEDMIVKAWKKSVEMGSLSRSITKGDGNEAGFLGEQIVWQHIGGEWVNTYDYDIKKDNALIDVKTKRTSVEPKPFYECTVSGLNTKQNCTHYAFTRVLNDKSKGWILGIIPKDMFYDNATFIKKGEVDTSNNFKAKTDMYNLSIKELQKLTKDIKL